MTNQLVHLPKAEEPKQKAEAVVNTPFQAFVTALQERQAQGTLRSMHSAMWETFPVERLLADAGWALLTAVAGKIGQTISTRNDVRSVAERTDRLLGVGLILVHGSPEAAAEAFDQKVLGAIGLAIRHGYRPGHELSREAWKALALGHADLAQRELRTQKVQPFGALSSLWTTPAYLFLADCFKVARELHDDLLVRSERFGRRNVIGGRNLTDNPRLRDINMFYVSEGDLGGVYEAIRFLDVLDSIESVVNFSRPDFATSNTAIKSEEALSAKATMADLELRLATLRAIPIDFSALPEESLLDSKSIEETWVLSAVLCAAIGRKNETCPSGQYTRAMKKVRKLTMEAIIEQTVAAIRQRDTQWTPAQEDCFRTMVAVQAKWCQTASLEVTVESAGESMIEVDVLKLSFDHAQAVGVAIGDVPSVTETLAQKSKQVARTFFETRILPAIDWSDLSSEKVLRMFEEMIVPDDLLISGLAKMEPKDLQEVVSSLMASHPELISLLVTGGLIPVDGYLLNRYPEAVPADKLADLLRSELTRISFVHGSDVASGIGLHSLVVGLKRLQSGLRTLFEAPATRPALVGLVQSAMDGVEQLTRMDVEIIAAYLGNKPLWREFVAAALVVRRTKQYAAEIDPDFFTVSWLDLAKSTHPDYAECKWAFRLDKRENLAVVLTEYTEERAFRFLHEGDPEVEKLWQDYLAAQQRHERAHGRR